MEEKAPSAPASKLLFQAPEFTAPAFQEPQHRPAKSEGASDATEEDAKKKGSQGQKKSPKKGGGQQKSAQKGSQKKGGADSDDSQAKGGQSKGGQAKGSEGQKKAPAQIEARKASAEEKQEQSSSEDGSTSSSTRRRRRRPRSGNESASESSSDQVQGLKGSTRLEAKRMRRREGRKDSRRRQSITEAEFLARREAVDREMVIRHRDGADQVAVLEDGILVEHFVARKTTQSIVGNIYLGRVQNVLPSMEAAFVDIGRGRNAVLYAGEVNWDALGMEGKHRRIETALKSGDTVMVQVTKDPIGHKGARLTSQITLAGRYLVFVPGSSMLGISRKLPDNERNRLKKLLREIVPDNSGVIVRTAAEGATEDQLRGDVERLMKQWESIQKKAETSRKAPILLRGEPELVVRVARDLFNEDFKSLVVQGKETWETVRDYVDDLSPELAERVEHWTSKDDVFRAKKVDQQLAKAMDRKVWLPSGGTLVIERTEALTVVDVNTGKFVGSGGTLEETVTRNNLEAAEEIVRQLRLRDIGGIVIIDFVDMVLESNRELVLRRLVECLGRDRTRHQVTEITSLGLVQMTRKRVGEGLVEAFSTACEVCDGRGFIVHEHPVEVGGKPYTQGKRSQDSDARGRGKAKGSQEEVSRPETHVGDEKVRTALSAIAAASQAAAAEEAAAETPAKSASAEAASAGAGPAGVAAGPAEPKTSATRLDDISAKLPDPSQRPAKVSPTSTRRVAKRAAGSPPKRSTLGQVDPAKQESARDAVRSLLDSEQSS